MHGSNELFVVAILLLIIGCPAVIAVVNVVTLVRAFRDVGRAARWISLLRGTPRIELREPAASATEVCVDGRAVLHEVEDSPVQGQECVGFAVELREGLFGRAKHRGVEVVRFRVVSEDGSALVDGESVTAFYSATPARRHVWERRGFHPFLEEYIHEERLRRGWLRRATEWRLEPGEACTVLGTVVRREPDGDGAAYREPAALPLIGRGRAGLFVSAGSPCEVRRALRRAWAFAAAAGMASGAVLAAMLAFALSFGTSGSPDYDALGILTIVILGGTVVTAVLKTVRRALRWAPLPAHHR